MKKIVIYCFFVILFVVFFFFNLVIFLFYVLVDREFLISVGIFVFLVVFGLVFFKEVGY